MSLVDGDWPVAKMTRWAAIDIIALRYVLPIGDAPAFILRSEHPSE